MSSEHNPNRNSLRVILSIEDNLTNALLVDQMIAQHSNLKLLMAANGYEGIQIASTHQPDLILMDINLPDINGLEVMKILQEKPETAHIPIIAVSSNAYPKQIEEGIKAEFFRYLTKPFKINDLMNAINETAEKYPTFLP